MGYFKRKKELEEKKKLYYDMARYILEKEGHHQVLYDKSTPLVYENYGIHICKTKGKLTVTSIEDCDYYNAIDRYNNMKKIYDRIRKEEKEQKQKEYNEEQHKLKTAAYIAETIGYDVKNSEKKYLEHQKYKDNTITITRYLESKDTNLKVGIKKNKDINEIQLVYYLEQLSDFIKDCINNGKTKDEILVEVRNKESIKEESDKIYPIIEKCFNYFNSYQNNIKNEVDIIDGRVFIKIKKYERDESHYDDGIYYSKYVTEGYKVKLRSDVVYDCKLDKTTVYRHGMWEKYLTDIYNNLIDYEEKVKRVDERVRTKQKEKQKIYEENRYKPIDDSKYFN